MIGNASSNVGDVAIIHDPNTDIIFSGNTSTNVSGSVLRIGSPNVPHTDAFIDFIAKHIDELKVQDRENANAIIAAIRKEKPNGARALTMLKPVAKFAIEASAPILGEFFKGFLKP